MKDEPRLMSVKDAAKALTLGERTVRRWVAEGRLPAVRIGKSYRIREMVVMAAREKGLELV